MGTISKLAGKAVKWGTGPVITTSVAENYIKQMNKEGKDWSDLGNIANYFGKTGLDRITKVIKSVAGQFKNEGGMMHARKKNMGLKYNKGGCVKKPSKKSSKKSRGTGAAKKGTKFKGTF